MAATPSAAYARAVGAFRDRGGVLRTKQALDLGIQPRTLYLLRDDGVIDQLSRGLWRLADLPVLTRPGLITVALRVPRAIICLISALDCHASTSEIPHEVHITLPRGTKTPKIEWPPVRVFRFSGIALTEGLEIVHIDEVPVRMYCLEKTVVDCFRLRSRIGLDVAIDALRIALHDRRVAPADILRYARHCRVESVIGPYIEALLG